MKISSSIFTGASAAFVFGLLAPPALADDNAIATAKGFAAKYEKVVATKDAARLADLFNGRCRLSEPKWIL